METAEVIRRVLAGEERLFEVLVKRHAGMIRAICSSYVPNWADREDVAQDMNRPRTDRTRGPLA